MLLRSGASRDTLSDMLDALVLAGGAGQRLGQVDKAALVVGGVPLLERVLAALTGADRVVVVGPERPTTVPVTWTREEPPGGGPVAALEAGLQQVSADRVLLLAVDLPFLTRAYVEQLAAPLQARTVGRLAGPGQWLCSCWQTEVLRRSVAEQPAAGRSLRSVLATLPAETLEAPGESPLAWTDVDTVDDLRRARERA